MSILNKYLLKTIFEKKGRLFLMLFAIIISTALLIASFSVVDLLTDIYMYKAVEEYGDYNIHISKSNNVVWDIDEVDKLEGIQYLSVLESTGYVVGYKNKEFRVLGVSNDEFKKYDAMKAIHISNKSFNGKTVMISDKVSKSLGVKLDDSVTLFIDGEENKFQIVGIYENDALFKYDGKDTFSIIIPKDNLKLYDKNRNNCTQLYCCISSDTVDEWANDFNESNNDNKIFCTKTYDKTIIRSQFEWIQTPMIFMLIISLVMSTFIIFCTTKLIVSERLTVFGTFFSQGATFTKIYALLALEGIFNGIIGGVVGCVAGNYLTQFISNYSIYGFQFLDYEKCSINPVYFLVGFVFSIVFSAITVLIPVFSIRKMQVKEIILNLVNTEKISNKKSILIGVVFIIITIVCVIIDKYISYMLSIPCVCIFLVGAIILISPIVKSICAPLSRFLRGQSITGMLSFNNVSSSNIIKNNITLIVVCIMSITIISSLSASITDVINGSYSKMNFNICANINILKSDEFGEKVFDEFDKSKVFTQGAITSYLKGDTLKPIQMYYIDTENYAKFDDYMTYEEKESQIAELDTVHNGIIISKRMAKTYGIEKGDKIVLTVNDEDYQMYVTSIVDCRMYASGNYNIITKETASAMYGYDVPIQYYIQTDLKKKEVKEKLKGYGAEIIDKADLIKDAENEMKQFIDILLIFSYVTMIMGGFGIISNVAISFIQRKKEMAVITSLGMSNAKKVVMLLIESVIMAFLGVVLGIVIGGISLYLIGDVFTFLMLDLNLGYEVITLSIVSGLTILIVLLTTLPIVRKFLKLDIVKELKYE